MSEEKLTLSDELRLYNAWRRGDDEDLPMPDPTRLGVVIDQAAARLEVLTKQRDELLEALERLLTSYRKMQPKYPESFAVQQAVAAIISARKINL